MGTEYHRLGDYIREVNVRNRDLKVTNSLGLSMSKQFRPSTSNIVGVNLSNYKVVNKNVFAFDPMSVIRVHRVPIALNIAETPIIVYPAYFTFECTNPNELDPHYLMMWFQRTEFDRYADFKSDSAIRGGYNWEELCDTMIHIPSIARQREIVSEYETLVNRIRLNEQMIEKLEATAQALYRKMFVDGVDKENTESLSNLCYFQEGYVNPPQEDPEFFDGEIKWIRAVDVNGGYIFNTSRTLTRKGYENAGKSAYLFEPDTIVITKSGTIGRLGIVADYMCGNRAVINIRPKRKEWLPLVFLFLSSKQMEFENMAVGSAQKNLYVPVLSAMQIVIPKQYEYAEFNALFSTIKMRQLDNLKLTELQSLLLAKIVGFEYELEGI